MKVLCHFFLVIVLLSVSIAAHQKKTSLHFGYITSLSGSFVASGSIPVADLALKLINERTDILQNYSLTYTDILDSECHRTSSLNQFFELVNRNTTYVALLGCGCSTATLPVAEISHYWNMPQVDFASSTDALYDRARFRNFFRTIVSQRLISASLGKLMQEFGWRQMGLITQDEALFQGMNTAISNVFEERGWILYGSVFSTEDSVTPFFERIVALNIRINNINSYPDFAYRVLCEAYYRGLSSPEYVWFIPMWFSVDWWKTVPTRNSSCTNTIMVQVLNRVVGMVPNGYFPLEDESRVTFSGLTSRTFLNNYTCLLKEPKYQNLSELGIAGIAFDALWAIAVGLDIASKKILAGNENDGCDKLSGELVPLEHFNYTNLKLGCVLKQSFSEVNFLGITGRISFVLNGSRSDNVIKFHQYREISDTAIKRVTVGHVIVRSQSIFRYKEGESLRTLWNDGVPPYDGYPGSKLHPNNIVLVVIYNVAAVCGIAFVAVCFTFNIVFSNKKIVKLTSPNLNYFIILGSTLLYVTVFFYSYASDNQGTKTIFCNIGLWLFSLGYNLCFGVILSRTWRVYYIFNNPKAKKKSVKDWMLMLIVATIVAIDLTIIFVGTIISSTRMTATVKEDVEHPQEIAADGEIEKNFIVVCDHSATIIWQFVSFGYKGILQICAIFMAFHTRNVNVKVLNESKEIAAIIYINSIILVVLAVTELILDDNHNTYAALFGLSLLIEASLFLGFIFIPKIIRLYLDPHGVKIFTHTAVTHLGKTVQSKVAPKEMLLSVKL